MRVRDVMKSNPSSCRTDESLAEAAEVMRRVGCGVLPVVDGNGILSGILTDRDICCTLAGAERNSLEIAVSEAMTAEVRTCRASDPIHDGLEAMKEHRVRRLPVIDAGGHVEGILSLDDVAVAAHAKAADAGDVTWRQVGAALQAISEHPTPARVT